MNLINDIWVPEGSEQGVQCPQNSISMQFQSQLWTRVSSNDNSERQYQSLWFLLKDIIMLVIPVYPLVLVGIIVVCLFSFAIWLMCYESVVNRKLIASSNSAIVRDRTRRQQRTGLVSNDNIRETSLHNTRHLRGNVVSSDTRVRDTTTRSYSSRSEDSNMPSTDLRVRDAIGVRVPSGQYICGTQENVPNDVSLGQSNLAYTSEGENNEQRQIHGGVTGLPSYNEATKSRRGPDLNAPPKYEDLVFDLH